MIRGRACLGLVTVGFVASVTGTEVQLGSHAHGVATVTDSEMTALLRECVESSGPRYMEARDELLSGDRDRVVAIVRRPVWRNGNWKETLVANIVGVRVEYQAKCDDFERKLERFIEDSWTKAIIPNTPVSGPIKNFCVRSVEDAKELEAMVLERLFKYDDPPHVKHGLARALGAVGTEASLQALISLMNSTEDGSLCAHSAMSVAGISGRLGDTRAVPKLVELYRTRPRTRGTGLPEEVLRDIPPGFQATAISALRHIGGKEALLALQELRVNECDPALVKALDKAQQRVRGRLEESKDEQAEKANGGE